MKPTHYVVITAFLAAIGTQLSTLQGSWAEVLSPTFVGASLVQIAAFVGALFSQKIGSPPPA